ncbi:DoxX family protein [Fulvivirga maritima]|uniref:DoxX family protein n=1 Tax=Fulvivirga maritima TaxID=2904247 RepID=UPI001F27B4BF|nr:MauE/DoxX family redox-associated membrane protein [Fulvivirga maritima]UII26272.1 DoxX family protein [Fulvivirga maritima]
MQIGMYVMAVVYIGAGIFHFVKPKMYRNIIPPYFPKKLLLVYLSGVAEIAFGAGLLLDETRAISAWLIILMLLAFMPVHIYMLQSEKFKHLPRWILIIRLPLQLILMYWAFLYT